MKTIGLVGCGNWGSNILRDILRLGCRVYVADIDRQARLKAPGTGAAEAFSQADKLPDCDGYVVAVPIPDLTPVCAGLLERKKPIFSEKTLCLSMEDYDLLKALGGCDYIFAMHKWHYHPGIEALRLVGQSGEIGVVQEVCTVRHAWVNDFHGGDVFWTQAVHDLTIVKHLLGYVPGAVRTIHVVKNETQLPVGFTAVLGDEPAIVLSVSGRHCNKISGVTLHGNRGAAALHDAYDDHLLIRNESGERKMAIETTLPLYLELKEFVTYLEHGPAPRCNLIHAKEMTQASFAQWAVKSVRNQTIKDIEICIICDGSPESMVTLFQKMAQEDRRMKVFTFPKAPRTGEPYRDFVIKQTTGKIISYCSHDDLWLPNHLQEMEDALTKCRFAHSLDAVVDLPEAVRAGKGLFKRICLKNIRKRSTTRSMFGGVNSFGLTYGAHTRDSYFMLEEGWVTTPQANVPTDLYMWCKFLAAFPHECKTIMKITALNFQYIPRKAWSEQQRDDELKYYFERIQDPDFVKTICRCLVKFRIKKFLRI